MAVSRRALVIGAGSAAAVSTANRTAEAASRAADLVVYGGAIVTMEDAQPTVEAVAVKDGVIVAVGGAHDILEQWTGHRTRVIHLHGKAMLPGFIDGHGHFMNAPRLVNWVNVSAQPAGPVGSIADIQKAFRDHAAQKHVAKGEWVLGYGYDRTGLSDGREMTRHDLDAALPDNPVMAIHSSNHGAVLNTAAMKLFDITDKTPTPEAGVILREPGSNQPAGLLMETAFLPIFAKVPQPGEAEMLELLKPAQAIYASKGVTTAQEGATHADELVFLRKAAAQHRLFIDVVSLPFIAEVPRILVDYLEVGTNGKTVVIGDPSLEFGHYRNRLKLGGIKFVLDGSPQGKTAFWTKPLLTGGPEGQKDWVGEPTFPKPVVLDLYKKVAGRNIQVWCHANGDAAIDLAIAAAEAAGVKAGDDRRNVVIHSQCMRPDQLDKYAALGLTPSFFVVHTFFWGDEHLANLGPERAAFLSPMKSAQNKGIAFSNHNDFSVTPLDPMRMVWSAVQRKTKTGVVLGPDERIDVMTALKAITVVPAWHYREEASKGSIAVGKKADLVILDQNPLTVPVDDILAIKVVETLKEGHTIYPAPGKKKAETDAPFPFATRRPSRLVADDCSAPAVGCACCVGGLAGAVREDALTAMNDLAASPLLS